MKTDRSNPSRFARAERTTLQRHVMSYGAGRAFAIVGQVGVVLVLSYEHGTLYLSYSIYSACLLAVTNLSFGWMRQAMLRNSGGEIQALRFVRPPPAAIAICFFSASITVVVAATALGRHDAFFIATCWAASFTFVLSMYAATSAQATLRPAMSARFEASRLVLTAVLPAILFLLGARLTLPLVLLSCCLANSALPLVQALRSTVADQVEKRDLRNDLRYGGPMAVWLMFSTLLQFSDRWILANRVNHEVASAYAVSFDLITRGTTALLAPLILATHPLLMDAANRSDQTGYRVIWRQSMSYFARMAGLIIVGSLIFARWGHVVAPSAATSVGLVLLLTASGLAWQCVLLLHKPFELRRQTGRMVLALVLALLVNVLANWTFGAASGPATVAALNGGSVILYLLILVALPWNRNH